MKNSSLLLLVVTAFAVTIGSMLFIVRHENKPKVEKKEHIVLGPGWESMDYRVYMYKTDSVLADYRHRINLLYANGFPEKPKKMLLDTGWWRNPDPKLFIHQVDSVLLELDYHINVLEYKHGWKP